MRFNPLKLIFEVQFEVHFDSHFLTESSQLPVLYSGHKESGLIRISLSIGLGGPGWARGLYMDRKRQRGPVRPPCSKWNMPLLSPPGRQVSVRDFSITVTPDGRTG